MAKKKNKKIDNIYPDNWDNERIHYQNRMSYIWISISFIWISTFILLINYNHEIMSQFSLINKYIAIFYVIIYLVWINYRVTSRSKIRNASNFQSKFDLDYNFAKAYNNRELRNTIFSSTLIAVPLIYMSNIFSPLLAYFGIDSSELYGILIKLILSLISWLLENFFAAIFGGFVYDFFKEKVLKKK